MWVEVKNKDLGLEGSFEVLDEKLAYVLRHPEHGTVIVWADDVEEISGEGSRPGIESQGQEE